MTGRLHIGLVCPYSIAVPGGVQNHVLGLAGWLHSAGHRVSVLAPDRAPDQLWHRHGLPADVFTSAGPSVPVPYNGSVARINFDPRTRARVRRWLDGAGLDVLHLHEPITPSASILALWRSQHERHRSLPVVATFHTATPRSRTMRLARPVLTRSIDRISARVAVSTTAADVVRTHLHRDTQVIPNGIDHRALAPAQHPAQHRVARRLMFLGRLDEPRKGLELLLRAWPEIRERHPDAELLLAGAGRRRDLPEGCRRLGLVDDDTRAALLGSADLFIAPHRGRESFGLVVAEAMAAGAVVVAADIPAFVDVLTGVNGERHGHLFRAGDRDALVAAVLRALDQDATRQHPVLREDAVRAARNYDWDSVAPRVVQVYRATAATRHPADRTIPRQLLVP